MLKKIKQIIGEFILRRRYKNHSRSREVKNISDCKNILILASEPEDMGAMNTTEFTRYLKDLNKEVVTLFLPERKKENKKSYSADIMLIEPVDLNLFYIPDNPELLDLLDRDFDILIDLSLGNIFSLKYIHALSKAKFKVGAALNYKNDLSDLTIDIRNNPTVEYLLTQLKHYLTNINKDVT